MENLKRPLTAREDLERIILKFPDIDWLEYDGHKLADHIIANCVTVQEPAKKAEDCRCYTKTNYGGGCLGTKEIDPCKGAECESWKPKEEQQLSDIMIEIPRKWFPDGEKLHPLHKNDQVFLYYTGDPTMMPDERYIILSAYETDTLRAKNISLQHELEKAMLEKADLEKKLHAKTANGGIVAEVSRAGVCEVCGDGAELIKVNDHNLGSELEKAIEQLNPDCDHRGAFAARVTISVELLGDIEEGSE